MKIKNNKIIYKGEIYPPTRNNAEVYARYRRAKTVSEREGVGELLSKVVLDI